MKISKIILLACLFFGHFSYSQSDLRAIKISDPIRNSIILVTENKHIVVKTKHGISKTGRFKIIDENTISIRGKNIDIKDIVFVKKKPIIGMMLNVVKPFFIAGIIVLGVVLVRTLNIFNFHEISRFYNTIITSSIVVATAFMIYRGIKIFIDNSRYRKHSKGFNFEIIGGNRR